METAKFSFRFQSNQGVMDDFKFRETSHMEFDLNKKVTKVNLEKMKNDCKIFSGLLETNPEKVLDILNHSINGNKEMASKIGSEIGFTEASFKEKGGGVIWLIVGIGVLLYSQRAN